MDTYRLSENLLFYKHSDHAYHLNTPILIQKILINTPILLQKKLLITPILCKFMKCPQEGAHPAPMIIGHSM